MTDLTFFISEFPALTLGFCLLFALCVGSFLNVVIYRLPLMLERQWKSECREFLADELAKNTTPTADTAPFNLMVPRSRCPSCNNLIAAWQNIPLLSWLALRGKCAQCKTKISIRYPLVELSSALLCYCCYLEYGFSWGFVAASGFCAILLTLALIDLDTMLLPDQLTLPTLWLGLLLNSQSLFVSLQDAVLGAAIGYMALWTLFWAFKLLTGKEGMGYGDFKLLALIGAWFGWQALPLTILLSSAAGATVGIGLILAKRHQQGKPIPFGPYLIMGGLAYMFIGEELYRWYLGYIL